MTNTGHSVIFYTGNWDEENGGPGGDVESTLGGVGRGSESFLGGGGGGGPGNGGVPGSGSSQPKTLVNITGGPLSYRYQFHEIHIHYGMRDDAGSEHTVDAYAFPAEVCTLSIFSCLHPNGKKNSCVFVFLYQSGMEDTCKNPLSLTKTQQ